MAAKRYMIRPETRNPLGQRLLRALELSGMTQSEVSEAIGERRTALGTRIWRLEKGAPENLDLDKVVSYAMAMRVSVAWLCSGVGDPWDAPYAIPESSELRRLPENARRAIHAASALDDLHRADLILAAAAAADGLSAASSPRDWLAAIQDQFSSGSIMPPPRKSRGSGTTVARPRRMQR